MHGRRPAGRGPTTEEKIATLRALVEEVGLVSQRDMAERWGVSKQAVRQLLDAEDAPEPLRGTRLWPLPEVERYRSVRLQRAGNRGGKHV